MSERKLTPETTPDLVDGEWRALSYVFRVGGWADDAWPYWRENRKYAEKLKAKRLLNATENGPVKGWRITVEGEALLGQQK